MSRLSHFNYRIAVGVAMTALLLTVNCMVQPSDVCAGKKPATDKIMPGIQIKVSPRYPAAGPIRVHVTMLADMPTYYANNGNIDRAMEVFLVRRDAPGIRQLAKIDPHAMMEPEIPLPPPVPGKKPAGFIKEERDLDVLAYGARHEGGADYYAVGILAGRMSDPQPLSIDDQHRRLPAMPVRNAPPLVHCKSAITPPSSGGIVARPGTGPVSGIEGAFRVRLKPSARKQGKEMRLPFVTVIAARIDPHGGVSSGSFQVQAREAGRHWTGKFSIPASLLIPRPVPGRYRVLVFSGDEISQPVDMDILMER
jgi:hypothetical protein